MGRYLYVRNISLQATEEDLRTLFSVSGKVVSVHLTKDRQSGEFNGCGFIKMGTDAEAKDAIECLDDARFLSEMLMVEEARSNIGGGSAMSPDDNRKGGKHQAVGKGGDRSAAPSPAKTKNKGRAGSKSRGASTARKPWEPKDSGRGRRKD